MKKQKTTAVFAFMLVLLLQACNLPSNTPAQTPTADPLLAAQMTITALAGQSTPTQPLPTFTAPPTLTPTATLSPTPAFTSTPSFPYLTLSEGTNCRTGPAISFDLVDTFLVGQTIEILGKHPFDNYWFVRSPNNPSVSCWLWGFYATPINTGNVPALTPPPTYTPVPAPSFDATYVNSGKCLAWWTRINLKNTGQVDLKSMSISIKDTVTNETRNSVMDGFQDVNACVLSPVTVKLGPGEAYTIVSPNLSADPAGHKLTVTITLCSGTGQGGTCASKTIEFTP